jgi:drug/metabolite transporter (DMT)-like permease
MTPGLAGGLGLALASALALDVGFLIQQSAVAHTSELSPRRPLASARALLDSRRWLAGFVLGLGGWVLYFAALALAPLSLVQTVAASGIGLLVVLVALTRRAWPVRRERAGALLATLGLMALAVSAGRTGATTSSAPSTVALCALAAGALVVVACALRKRSAALGGLAAGLCYGTGDVTSKALLIGLPHHPTPAALVAAPLLYATAGAHGVGFVLLQRAFQHGGALASLAPMTAATNLLPIAAGVLLLGERLPAGDPALALRLGAFAAAVAGAWALAGRGAPAGALEEAPETDQATPWLQSQLTATAS